MNGKPVTVVAQIKAKQGAEEQVRKELLALVAPSRMDRGCQGYDLHQGEGMPGLFMFYENWASHELLEEHLQKPELQSALGRLSALSSEPPRITLWEKIGI